MNELQSRNFLRLCLRKISTFQQFPTVNRDINRLKDRKIYLHIVQFCFVRVNYNILFNHLAWYDGAWKSHEKQFIHSIIQFLCFIVFFYCFLRCISQFLLLHFFPTDIWHQKNSASQRVWCIQSTCFVTLCSRYK